jgi:hypothetical protein
MVNTQTLPFTNVCFVLQTVLPVLLVQLPAHHVVIRLLAIFFTYKIVPVSLLALKASTAILPL